MATALWADSARELTKRPVSGRAHEETACQQQQQEQQQEQQDQQQHEQQH